MREISSWARFHHGCHSTVLLAKIAHLDGISAIAILCGPPIKTLKVLNLSNQQWSALREETKV